jgi:hypothetical protein
VNRRLAAGITAAAVAGAAAVTTLANHQPAVQLTAWTVVTQGKGDVVVTIRGLRHPGGVQHNLCADGIPASVQFYPGKLQGHAPFGKLFHLKRNPCQQYSAGQVSCTRWGQPALSPPPPGTGRRRDDPPIGFPRRRRPAAHRHQERGVPAGLRHAHARDLARASQPAVHRQLSKAACKTVNPT